MRRASDLPPELAGAVFRFSDRTGRPIFDGQRTGAIVDRQFAERIADLVLHKTERTEQAGRVIAHELSQRIAQRGDVGGNAGRRSTSSATFPRSLE